MSANVHPFEAAKLGKAPFVCVGCRENRYEMPGFGWKPGGCCNYCGTGILYEFVIRGVEGATRYPLERAEFWASVVKNGHGESARVVLLSDALIDTLVQLRDCYLQVSEA